MISFTPFIMLASGAGNRCGAKVGLIAMAT